MQVNDTNTTYLCQELRSIGCEVVRVTIVQVSSLPQCRCVIVACVTIVCVPCVTIVCVTIACVTIVRSLPSHATLVLGGLPLKAYLGWPELCVYIHVCKMYVFFILSEEKCYCGSELAFSA